MQFRFRCYRTPKPVSIPLTMDEEIIFRDGSRDLKELAQDNLSADQRTQIRLHAQWAIEEGRVIFKRLNPN
jgi:hypothetical protein